MGAVSHIRGAGGAMRGGKLTEAELDELAAERARREAADRALADDRERAIVRVLARRERLAAAVIETDTRWLARVLRWVRGWL